MALTAYQAHMKRELKGKMKNKTKSQRKAIFKAAARSWKSKSKSSKGRSGSSNKTRSTKRSTGSKKKGGTRRVGKGGFSTTKIFKLLRMGALAMPAATIAMSTNTPEMKLRMGMTQYTGFDPNTGKFDFGNLLMGWGPFLGATLATVGIPKLTKIIRSF